MGFNAVILGGQEQCRVGVSCSFSFATIHSFGEFFRGAYFYREWVPANENADIQSISLFFLGNLVTNASREREREDKVHKFYSVTCGGSSRQLVLLPTWNLLLSYIHLSLHSDECTELPSSFSHPNHLSEAAWQNLLFFTQKVPNFSSRLTISYRHLPVSLTKTDLGLKFRVSINPTPRPT